MIIPDDVLARWRTKVEQSSPRPELVLPFASNVALAMSGLLRDPWSIGALRFLISVNPEELPLELGAAGCKELDRLFSDAHRGTAGRGSAPLGRRAMESVLIATDEAIHYIAPNVRQHRRWQWNVVQLVRLKDGRHLSKIALQVPEASYKVTLGPPNVANLLAVQAWWWSCA